MLEICTHSADGSALDDAAKATLEQRYELWTGRGIRVLAVATRCTGAHISYGRNDERDMRFMGFITFLDRPREGVAEALQELTALGVSVKLITGDSALVARHVASLVGLSAERVITGRDLATLLTPAYRSTMRSMSRDRRPMSSSWSADWTSSDAASRRDGRRLRTR